MARKRPAAPLSSSGNPILDISVAREAGTLDDDAEKAGKKCVLLVPFCGLPALALGVGQPAASALTTTITDRIHTTKRRDWIQDTYSSLLFWVLPLKRQSTTTDSSSRRRIFRCIKMTVRRKVFLELCQTKYGICTLCTHPKSLILPHYTYANTSTRVSWFGSASCWVDINVRNSLKDKLQLVWSTDTVFANIRACSSENTSNVFIFFF